MLFFLALALISMVLSADPYTCGGSQQVDPSSNLNVPYYWPNNWNETMDPATYAGSQSCNWKINVPQGMFATVIFYKDTDSESGITSTYPNGEENYIEDMDLNPYIFTSPQFQVNLHVSDRQGKFSFKVTWSKYPPTCQMNMYLDGSSPMVGSPNECVTTFIAPNEVFFVGFTLQDNRYSLLRQSAIYEGDSVNGKYLGNLYSARYNQLISSGNKLTLYTFGLLNYFHYTLFMGLDSQAVGDVKQMTGYHCPSDPTASCGISINSEQSVSAVATVGQETDYIQPFLIFPAGVTMNLYEGRVSDEGLLASLNGNNYYNQLPIGVKNVVKIYKLDSGRMTIPITRNATVANYGTVFDGRILNIHSFDRQINSYNQDTNEVYSTANNEKLYFKFNVKFSDFAAKTSLAIQITRDGKVVFANTFTASNIPPPNVLKVYGDQMSVSYQTYGLVTKGFEINLTTVMNG